MSRLIRTFPRPPAGLRELPLGGGHTLAYRDWGPADGPVWLALHGGPGSGAAPGLWQPFDLSRQRVLAPDQRGSGRSRPRGGLRGQHIDELIRDLEKLRQSLQIPAWSVLGGSWGATLALLYAAHHPQAVEALVLRGSFQGRRSEVTRLLRRFWPAGPGAWPRHIRPASAGRVLHRLSQVFHPGTLRQPAATAQALARDWQAMEQAAALRGAWRAWLHARGLDERVALRAAWQALRPAELQRRRQRPAAPVGAAGATLWAKYRVQSHHLARLRILGAWRWHEALRTVARHRIPVVWVHGRYDAVCRFSNSSRSHHALLALNRSPTQLLPTHAGHLGTEPANLRALTQQLAAAAVISAPTFGEPL